MSSQEEFELAEVPDVAMVMAMASAAPPRPPPPAMIGYGGLESPPPELCQACGQRHLLEENHEYLYRDEVDNDLVCHICLQPLIRPLDTPCGHTYCQECLTSFLLESDFCPVDRTPLMLQNCRKSSLLVHKLLDKLAVACPFTDHCTDTLPRGEMEGHIKNRLSGYLSISFMMCECDVGGPGVSGDQLLSGRSHKVLEGRGYVLGEEKRHGECSSSLIHPPYKVSTGS